MGMCPSKVSAEAKANALSKAKDIVSSNSVVVFSKTYCMFCKRVKNLLTKLGADYKVVELNIESDGAAIQTGLAEWTDQSTVPNFFINGKHIGGSNSVMKAHDAGRLVPMLEEAGAFRK